MCPYHARVPHCASLCVFIMSVRGYLWPVCSAFCLNLVWHQVAWILLPCILVHHVYVYLVGLSATYGPFYVLCCTTLLYDPVSLYIVTTRILVRCNNSYPCMLYQLVSLYVVSTRILVRCINSYPCTLLSFLPYCFTMTLPCQLW